MDANFAKSVADNANKTGQDALNSFDPTASQNNFLSSYNSMNQGQAQGSQDFAKQYAAGIAANPSVGNLYTQANQQFNVPGLMQQSNQLNNAMLTDPQQNVNAAKGFNYDANQIGQQTTQDLARLSPLAQAATNSAQTAQTLAGQQVQAGITQNQMNLLPLQSQQAFLMQQQGNQAQAYLTANQATMQALSAKVAAGVQLSQSESQQYQALVQAQAAVQSAQTNANATIQAANIGQQYKVVNPSQTVYNTQTQAGYTPIGSRNLQAFANSAQQFNPNP